MTVRDIVDNDFSFVAGLIIRGFNTGDEYANTPKSGWGDVPFDVYDKELVSMGVEDCAIVLMVED